jgi:two-component system sensor histidine kinase RstB
MRKLFLKVYLPLAICVLMTMIISVVAMFRIIPMQIRTQRENIERFRGMLLESGQISQDSVVSLAESLDLEVHVQPKGEAPPGMPPPEGFFELPGLPWNYPWKVSISTGASGGPAGFLRQSFWLVVLLLLISEGLVLFIALRPVRRRLAKLQWATGELASGNLGIKLHVNNNGDLIDDLGRTFNGMAEDIKSLVESHQELLGIVAHELRTPMARLRLALELLKEDSGDEHVSKIGTMESDLMALDNLVTELLDYNKLRRAREVQREAISLQGLCDDLARAESWSRNDVDIKVTGEGQYNGDISLMGRALGNLIRNAVRYAESRVRVTISQESCRGVLISVEDDGPGYEPNLMDRLGEPFTKGSSSSGTGLGLAITERIVLLHGGSLSFGSSSDLGGARATVSL